MGFEGSRPRRPFRLSVRTTAEKRAGVRQGERGPGKGLPAQAVHPGTKSMPKYEELEPPRTQGTLQRSPLPQGRQVDWRQGRTEGPGTPSLAAHQDRCPGGGGLRAPPHSSPSLSLGACPNHPPSFTMPTARHFWKRQNWQRFRRLLSTGQSLLARQMYLAFFCTVRWRGPTRNRLSECGVGVGDSQGRGLSRSYCHCRQKRSLFTTIFLTFGWQGRIRWMGWGRKKKSLGDTGGGFGLTLRTQDEG